MDGEDADNRQQDSDSGNQHRCNDGLELHCRVAHRHECRRSESRRCENRAAVAFVEVSPHSGNVAYVVAHIVGDGRRVARVVFRNAGLHFSYKVSPHIGRLCVDSASYTGKQRLCGRSHSESEHRGRDDA